MQTVQHFPTLGPEEEEEEEDEEDEDEEEEGIAQFVPLSLSAINGKT